MDVRLNEVEMTAFGCALLRGNQSVAKLCNECLHHGVHASKSPWSKVWSKLYIGFSSREEHWDIIG